MKKLVLIAILLLGGAIYAQDENSKNLDKDLNLEENLIRGTYYFENGNVQQKGTFNLEGELHGEWVMYNRSGKKVALGNYVDGKKDGRWFFWKAEELTEVEYNRNKIVDITEWKKKSQSIAAMN